MHKNSNVIKPAYTIHTHNHIRRRLVFYCCCGCWYNRNHKFEISHQKSFAQCVCLALIARTCTEIFHIRIGVRAQALAPKYCAACVKNRRKSLNCTLSSTLLVLFRWYSNTCMRAYSKRQTARYMCLHMLLGCDMLIKIGRWQLALVCHAHKLTLVDENRRVKCGRCVWWKSTQRRMRWTGGRWNDRVPSRKLSL